jgi:3-methyladenine DNA glycosylase AlkD
MGLTELRRDIRNVASAKRARINARFFKTKPGQYGHGDVFIGLSVPQARKIAHKHLDLPLSDVKVLMKSKIHEERVIGLEILTAKFRKSDETGKKTYFEFLLKNLDAVNNWDLVDGAAPYIIGPYLVDKPGERKILYKLAESKNLWHRRVAIIATYAFIRKGDFKDTFNIAELLMKDKHDLIHKAVGWMLREIGKRDSEAEEAFLRKHYRTMPRTALRYAIERFGKGKKLFYMS